MDLRWLTHFRHPLRSFPALDPISDDDDDNDVENEDEEDIGAVDATQAAEEHSTRGQNQTTVHPSPTADSRASWEGGSSEASAETDQRFGASVKNDPPLP